MNKPILAVGAILFVLACLFPPFLLDFGTRGARSYGYHFLFKGPPDCNECSVDMKQFSIGLMIASVGTGVALVLTRKEK